MVIRKNKNRNSRPHAGNTTLGRVECVTYLGCLRNDQWDHSRGMRQRIEKARATFLNMRNVLSNNTLSMPHRIRIVKCYVHSVLLYGVETQTLTDATTKKLDAFEMWIFTRILKISWTKLVHQAHGNTQRINENHRNTKTYIITWRHHAE